jgi:hypothetical protein
MPTEIALPMPPGDATALADLVRDVTGVASGVAELDERLVGAAASAPGWLGDDAAAAATQIGTVAALVAAVSEALQPAIARLAGHAERLAETCRRVTALREEQFAEAWSRWGQVTDLRLQVMTGGVEALAIVREVEAAEAGRGRRHTALLEELEDDAAATARVLADCCAVVGGRGVPGDANRVVAYLAAQLPGWGDRELARRGRALAEDLIDTMSTERRDELAGAALPFSDSAAFAGAFLAALGPVWMRDLLEALGSGDLGPTSSLARLVSGALGAASRGGATGPAAAVLAGEYTSADAPAGRDDLVVLGMGTVLAASLAQGSRGLDPRTVAAWGRQIALRERVVGAAAIDLVHPLGDAAAPVDALVAVVAILGDGTAPAAAAEFLNGSSVWGVLLARVWEDCGTSLQALVATAGTVEGPVGEEVVRGGLEALGAHVEDGNADDWPVQRATANAATPALAVGLAAHIALAGESLMSGVDGDLPAADGALLRGLGYVTLDRTAAGVVERALAQWVAVQTAPVWVVGPPPLLPSVVVPNAYLAVQDYGQRLGYALDELEREREASDRAFLYEMTVGLAAELAPGPWGNAAGVLVGYVAMALELDGTWDSPGDHGLRFAPEVPTAEDLAELTPEDWTVVDRVARMARGSFEGVQQTLGRPLPPVSDEPHWWEPLVDSLVPGPGDLLGRRGGVPGASGHPPR